MRSGDSIWFTTRSGLFEGGDGVWAEVALYAAPLERLLTRRYRWLAEAERQDLAQDILIEMKESLVDAHDRSRGKFRALLQTVVKRRVIDRLRKAKPERLEAAAEDALAAPEEEELHALDLETSLLDAVTACRDRFSQGEHRDLDVLYALIDRLVNGLSSVEIAEKSGVSRDRVARLLRRGREAIFVQFVSRELELPDGKPLRRCVDVFRRCLRTPRDEATLLEEIRDSLLRERLEEFLARFRLALPRFSGDASVHGLELEQGVQLIFAEDEA